MAPLEPWEKVLVGEDFLTSVHAQASCIDCHGGAPAAEKDAAHAGLIPNPSADAENTCGSCHAEVTESFATSLHATLDGYWTVLDARSGEVPENHPPLEEAFNNHCASCHTTCGECHVSQPNSVGGGLLEGHQFAKTPPMTRTCTACHGSRVGAEYLGQHEEYPGDVHFRQGRMKCVDCHTGEDLHAADTGEHRYAGEQQPRCESCHPDVGAENDAIPQHALHQEKLSCQVCHSITYTSCDGCHVQLSEETGKPFFKTEDTYFTFLIGRNARQDENRPYEYVPVRHVPISPTSFEFYGENLLPEFSVLPTWAYATPHNIQRSTPQNQACENCHNNPDIFLTADKVAPEELDANRDVIVEKVPGPIGR